MLSRLGAGPLPVLLAIILAVTVALTYCLAVGRSDVDPLLPYISGAATKRPESCVFAILLNISAFLCLLIMYLRRRLVAEFTRGSDVMVTRLNSMSTVFALGSVLGMLIVANFQETAVHTVHIVGALSCFSMGLAYFVLQSVITYRMWPLYSGFRICLIRGCITLAAVVAFAVGLGLAIAAGLTFRHAHPDRPLPRPWTRKASHEPGYGLHVASAFAEWTLAVCFVCFLLSFSRDFEKLRVNVVVQPLVLHLDESPVIHSPHRSHVDAPFI